MLISYTVKLTIFDNINNTSIIFNKDFESDITTDKDTVLYDNYHVIHKDVYVLDLFPEEVKKYCETKQITTDDIVIDEYEIVTLTENVEVFFENPIDINAFTLRPDIKCYIYPKEPPLKVPTLYGASYDSNTIIWTWPDDEQYAHYLVSEPIDFNSEEDKVKIIATIPIGAKHYIETGLEPNTAYSRRLINYTNTQTSLSSNEVTVVTETVNPQISLDKYYIERKHDWGITDSEREVITENLKAFKSGIGDLNDLKVYKQMDKDFYEKFKAYFTLTGKYTQREKRYDQVGFNYKICLEAKETIEEQEGEVTFKLDAYPWQEMYKTEYVWGIKPVTVYAKVYATIDLFKETLSSDTVQKEIKWQEIIHHEAQEAETSVNIVIDLSSSMRFPGTPGNYSFGRLNRMKQGAKNLIDALHSIHPNLEYLITGFAERAHTVVCSSPSQAKSIIDSMYCGNSGRATGGIDGVTVGNMTCWEAGLTNANGLATKPMKVMVFFTDGFPNTPGNRDSVTEQSITNGMNNTQSQKVYAIFGQAPVAYVDDGLAMDEAYVRRCHNNIIGHSKCIGHTNSNIDDDTIINAFGDATVLIKEAWDEVIEHSEMLDVVVPKTIVECKTVNLESELLSFTFDNNVTPVGYKDSVKRAEVLQKLIPTKMSNKSILQLLKEAKERCPEYLAGYNKNSTVKDENGNPIGDVYRSIYIKDSYTYGDEDPIPNLNFNSVYDYGMMGSINVNATVPKISTTDNTDDDYVATDDSFVYVSGYTNAIIYDCTRYGHVIVNGYSKPQETIFFRNDLATLLKNRENKTFTYGPNNIDSQHVFKKEIYLKVPDPCYMQTLYNGIDNDMIISIDKHWESPVLNYRFNLMDPDAFTAYYEILPDCNPDSLDKHVIILTVYYAENVEINSTAINDNYYALFDYNNPVQNPLEFKYGLNATWNSLNKVYDCDGHWISQYVHFFARKMKKTRDYYDELPSPNMDSMYGLVNGRYTKNNVSGKQDLIVDTPEFNIPTTVLEKHSDSIKIYIKVTEFYPKDALVSYKWHNESPVGSGYTQVNGDYVTFSSDSVIYKDIEYNETIATYETEEIEMFSQEPLEMMQSISRPVSNDELTEILFYNYLNTDESWKYNCELNGYNSIQINPNGTLSGPFVTLEKGRYRVKFSGDNLTACIFYCRTTITLTEDNMKYVKHSFNFDAKEYITTYSINDSEEQFPILYFINTDELDIGKEYEAIIPISIESQNDEEIIYRFSLYEDTNNIEFVFSCHSNAGSPVYIDGYFVYKTSGKYENYYLNIETDNGDVLATRYPTELIFDDDNNCVVPVTYRGLVNATSMWSPRIHNGYYYINQHEKYLYSEFNVEADFDKTENTVYTDSTVFINFDVHMLKYGGDREEYFINKDSKIELLQDEINFEWINDKGLTLKPVVEGQKYKHYEATTWESPIILFDNTLTMADKLTLDYIDSDESNTGLDLFVRSLDLEENKWTEWTEFINGTVPNTKLSCAYQLKTVLSATEIHTEYKYDDYLCCYLDWVDYIVDSLSYNIVTITDHITTSIYNSDGIAVSKIIEYACPTGMELSIYSSDNEKVIMHVAYSNDANDLILENIKWMPMTSAKLTMGYKYYRFKITIPKNEKVYWVHLSVNTLETDVTLPYIKSISMYGSYEPEDITSSFMKLETFKIPKDGLYHEVVPRIGDYISSEVIDRGFKLDEITSIDIKSTNPDVFLLFNTEILEPNPDPALLEESINAAASEATIDTINQLPYIFTKNNKIIINGTPQQYSPITVEDINGVPLKEIYNVNPKDMILTEIHTMKTNENYVELKRNDFELETMTVWINDDIINDYKIVNHLLMFKNFLNIDDVITVTYNVKNSFYTEIDRKNNTTTIYIYTDKNTNSLQDEYEEVIDEETVIIHKRKFKVMFETNKHTNKFVAKKLSLNPVYRTDYSGFIYLTEEHNVPYKIKIWCNPRRIKAGGNDTVDIQIEVLDIINNPVIAKEVKIDCNNGTIESDNYETDMNGVVHIVYKSSYLKGTDIITAKVLLDDELTNLQESIEIINY